jgi:uncharacterized protein YndB with AHSA1/START domain
MTETYTLQVAVGAPPATVYAALTNPAALRTWLAEYAEVALDDGVFEFWGRFTPDGERGRQRLLSAQPGRGLSFSWLVDGAETEVALAVEPSPSEPDGSVVTLTHSGVPPRAADDCYWVRDLLMLSLANLASYCEGRQVAPRCDFAAPRKTEARGRVEIDVPPDQVFAALIEPAELNRWIATDATVEPEVGGRYDFGWGHGPVKILELDPGRTLAYSWRHSWDDGDGPDSTVVRWELEGSQGRTYLTIVHSGFGDDRRPDGYQLGWQEFLVSLKRMLEVGAGWQPVRQTEPAA